MKTDHGYTNQLIHEASPYLQQHAHNPVNWHAWNAETLGKALKENKPLLVSIGYSSCHWCHVMEKESFSDLTVAELMNREFVCIKIDREERPDLDHFYMSAVQTIHRQGGWPLNCFALPDGKPFWGGTYFRKDQWLQILEQVAGMYKNHRHTIETDAGKILAMIGNSTEYSGENHFNPLSQEEALNILEKLDHYADKTYGGFGHQPKFPMPPVINLQMSIHEYFDMKGPSGHVVLTLSNIAKGGIFDQVGGGFARYSTDAEWHIPHFEKMLYDNAQLAGIYSVAYRLYGNPLFKETASRTIEFLNSELSSEQGAFFTALDADSDDEEGIFYTWTEEEICRILGNDANSFIDFFGIGVYSLWENTLNVLRKKYTEKEYAEKHEIDPGSFSEKIQICLDKLLNERNKRNPPLRDEKIICSVNALAINALIKAYRVFGREEYLERAMKTASFIRDHLFISENQLFHTVPVGKTRIQGLLEDYAYLTDAFLNLYEASCDETWFCLAEGLTETAIRDFYDPDKKVFWLSSSKSMDDILKTTDLHDGVVPSPVSVMAHNLFILGHLDSNPHYLEISRSLTGRIKKKLLDYPLSYANWAMLMLKMSFPFHLVCITGKDAAQLHREMLNRHRSDMYVISSDTRSELSIFKSRFSADGSNRIYICGEGFCLEPVHKVEEAIRLLPLKE